MRAFLIVLDSVGIGAAPDAAAYDDVGANTIAHLAEAVGGVNLPALQRLGLGNIPPLLPGGIAIEGVPPVDNPLASFGAMQEMSVGKDTTTGHWEMAGLLLEEGFHVFPPGPPSFPDSLVAALEEKSGRKLIANRAASGTEIIEELGAQQLADGSLIVYTSADSVLQIAAHEEIIPIEELYRICEIARELVNPYVVGRVIARPYVGEPGSFTRTQNRRDFSYPLPEATILDRLQEAGVETVTIGKLDDVFVHRGISRSAHLENNRDAQDELLKTAGSAPDRTFAFANLIDFDMLYGHRRDSTGYAAALENTDTFIDEFLKLLRPGDVMLVTADHGNDPTYKGTDHTREFVPLLVHQQGKPGESLGIRQGFFDIAQSLATYFGIPPIPRGKTFLSPTH